MKSLGAVGLWSLSFHVACFLRSYWSHYSASLMTLVVLTATRMTTRDLFAICLSETDNKDNPFVGFKNLMIYSSSTAEETANGRVVVPAHGTCGKSRSSLFMVNVCTSQS